MEDFPWAEPWARVTTALSNAVAMLARELSWQGTARQYGLNWKSVATIVKRAVEYGLRHRARPPVHVIGIDEVSRRKGQVYLTVVYDLERRVLLWVGDDRTEEAVKTVLHQRNGHAALPHAARRLHGHVGGVRQSGPGTRAPTRRSCSTGSTSSSTSTRRSTKSGAVKCAD